MDCEAFTRSQRLRWHIVTASPLKFLFSTRRWSVVVRQCVHEKSPALLITLKGGISMRFIYLSPFPTFSRHHRFPD